MAFRSFSLEHPLGRSRRAPVHPVFPSNNNRISARLGSLLLIDRRDDGRERQGAELALGRPTLARELDRRRNRAPRRRVLGVFDNNGGRLNHDRRRRYDTHLRRWVRCCAARETADGRDASAETDYKYGQVAAEQFHAMRLSRLRDLGQSKIQQRSLISSPGPDRRRGDPAHDSLMPRT
jgi:hypothetical protein